MKVVGAAIGAGVILTMGALTVALGGTEPSATGPAIRASGDTITQSTAPTSLKTPAASPVLKAPAYGRPH
jgi:hypothetical protein